MDLKDDKRKLFVEIDTLNNWTSKKLDTKDKPVKKMENYIKGISTIEESSHKLYGYCLLNLSVDTNNKQSKNLMGTLRSKMSDLTKSNTIFQKWLYSINNLDNVIKNSDYLKEHEFYIKENLRKGTYSLSEEEEVVISKLTNTGTGAWSELRNTLVSNLMFDINIDNEEKKVPLSIVRKLAFDKEPIKREKAYKAEINAYKKIEDSVAAALNVVKGQSLTVSQLRGYDSPLDATLINAKMDKSSLDAMFSAIKESLPIFHKYLRKKAQILRYKDGLPFYELSSPIIDKKVHMEYTYNDAKEYIVIKKLIT
ncbi:hypothetical protein [Dethiothermospora halolimnae]|uniref:hypothetical protein n=1 Tax=Dethiothermospora halolimnae TaxID=3114390 RepID=UPI003CCBFA85